MFRPSIGEFIRAQKAKDNVSLLRNSTNSAVYKIPISARISTPANTRIVLGADIKWAKNLNCSVLICNDTSTALTCVAKIVCNKMRSVKTRVVEI